MKSYYFTRGAFSIAWIVLAVTIAKHATPFAAALLIVYPAWDAVANYLDAMKNGGLKSNLSQSLNLVVSALTTVSVAIALGISMNAVLAVFGVWAILSGLFQLITGVRRWKSYGAQWAMILSGAQSALAGTFFLKRAAGCGHAGHHRHRPVRSLRCLLLPRLRHLADDQRCSRWRGA